MAKSKRWGKKYVDRRDWKTYNQQLIKRGEFYLNTSFLETWREELKVMNAGKVGQPFLYPESMIRFLISLWQVFPFRTLEGVLWALSKKFLDFPVICFSQIRRRILAFQPTFKPKKKKLFSAADGTGLRVGNNGEWLREHYDGPTNGWIKVVILGDTEGNIIDIRIGDEKTNENIEAREMINVNAEYLDKFSGDGLYDTKENFALLKHLGIEPVIKIRQNASGTHANGCMPRKKEVLLYKELGYKDWAKKKEYGKRWVATEGIFSAVKRMYGESVRSHCKENMYREGILKFWAYQAVKDFGKG